jgi:HAD superfamily hydrolase (TIGR01509 family)
VRPILLLDVMSTLVTEPFEQDIPAFFGMSLAELLAQKHPTAWVEFEHGTLTEEEYAARFFADGRPLDLAGFKAMMRRSYELMEGTAELLEELKAAGYPMYTLSNYSPWWHLIEEKLQLSRWVEWRFVSCITGVRKPHPEAYLIAARELGVAPGECLFVDDRQKNVDAAIAVGMRGLVRHPSIAHFRETLAAAGIAVGRG